MKIGRFGGPPPTKKVAESEKVQRPDEAGRKDFASVLEAGRREALPEAPKTRPASPASQFLPVDVVQRLSEALRTGTITRAEFKEQLVREILQRLPNVPESARADLAGRLLERLEENPTLQAKLEAIQRLAGRD